MWLPDEFDVLPSRIDALTHCLGWTALAAIACRETVTLHGQDLIAMLEVMLAGERPHAKA